MLIVTATIVSINDYKIARDMDTDNSGIIDQEEHDIGREQLARKFYEEANEYTQRNKLNHLQIKERAHNLATLPEKQFGRRYQRLKRKLWIKESRGGINVINCLNFKGSAPADRFNDQKFTDSTIMSARTQKLRNPGATNSEPSGRAGGMREALIFILLMSQS